MIIWEVARLLRGIDKISMNQDPDCWKGHSAWLSVCMVSQQEPR